MLKYRAVLLLALVSGASLGPNDGRDDIHLPVFPAGRRRAVRLHVHQRTMGYFRVCDAFWTDLGGGVGLTAMHTTYVCRVGIACAPDATDFYRMDPDGVRYFGGTSANAAGTQFSMMTYTNPEWLLKNPVAPGTMMGGPGGDYQNMETWHAGVIGTNSMMGGQSYASGIRQLRWKR